MRPGMPLTRADTESARNAGWGHCDVEIVRHAEGDSLQLALSGAIHDR